MSNVLPSVRYMAQLDGIRAFAVFGVIIDHWASAFPSRIREFTIPLDLSRFGVHMFFVLSGFLITSILLSTKSTGTPIRSALGHFYVRRILRIFPVYYATLLVACFFSDKIRDAAAWHALYLTNIYTSSFGVWLPAGHFWSLAVEEQFYLVWPLVILAVPLRSIRAFAVLVLVLAPASRFLLYVLHGGPHLSIYTSLMTNLDLLCFGGLLAYCKQTSPGLWTHTRNDGYRLSVQLHFFFISRCCSMSVVACSLMSLEQLWLQLGVERWSLLRVVGCQACQAGLLETLLSSGWEP